MAKFELKLAKWKSISLHFCRLESLELARLAGIVHSGADIIFAKKKKKAFVTTPSAQIYCPDLKRGGVYSLDRGKPNAG